MKLRKKSKKEEFKEGTFRDGRCLIIVGIENGLWHLSISIKHAQPSYKEIKKARYKYIPDNIYMAQIFPPKKEFINLHPYTHHLFEINRNEDIPNRAKSNKPNDRNFKRVFRTTYIRRIFRGGRRALSKELRLS